MPRTIRFHLDENCSHAIAAGLRRRGVDVTTTPEMGLLGAIDEDQLAFCFAQGKVIFSYDEFSENSIDRNPCGLGIYCRRACHKSESEYDHIIKRLLIACRKSFSYNGLQSEDDGARTRNLRRDRPVL
jgi:hypothetical protein